VWKLSLRPRRAIAGIKAVAHGGINPAELKKLGIDPNQVLDFSVCTNPFMPPPGLREKIGGMPLEQYPDSQATELKEKLSSSLRVPVNNILVGSGTTELIRLISLAYFRQGDRVMILEPTYGEYETACRLAGARPVKHRAREEDDFTPRMEEVIKLLKELQPRAVFICNPNNPTGKYLSNRDIEKVVANLGDGLLILDEAYIAFAGAHWDSLAFTARGNTVVLRSLTKDYGLPGLRLGYAVANREIIDGLRSVSPPWNVNTIAQGAGMVVLEQEDYLKDSLRKVRQAGRFLVKELIRLGFEVLPSDVHYFLVKAGDAKTWQSSLLENNILVRDCTSFGLGEYIRVSPRTLPECEKFIEACGRILNARKTGNGWHRIGGNPDRF
jgi:histidinol-phosphate aminotransferase